MLRHPVTRRARSAIAFVLCALALGVATGCDTVDPPAATVNGADVDDELVVDVIEALAPDNEALAGAGDDTVGAEPAAEILDALVGFQLVAEEVAARDLEVTADDRRQARESLPQLFGGQDAALGQRVLGRLSTESVDRLVASIAAQGALQRTLTESADVDAEARQLYQDNRASFVTYCLAVITLDSEEAATAARDEVEGGTDFADVARERSIDDAAEQGGTLGCEVNASDLQALPPEAGQAVAEATDGDLLGPFGPIGEAGSNFVVLRVGASATQSFGAVRDQLVAQVESQNRVQARLTDLRAEAEVTIDPRFGRWDAEVGVLPPRRVQGTPEPVVDPLQPPG